LIWTVRGAMNLPFGLPFPVKKGTSFPAARWPVSRLRGESIAGLGWP
jgi:hypothetical protein